MTSNKNAKFCHSLNVITEYNQTLKIFANKSTDVVVIPGIKRSKAHNLSYNTSNLSYSTHDTSHHSHTMC